MTTHADGDGGRTGMVVPVVLGLEHVYLFIGDIVTVIPDWFRY
jgi:hypothetical protein